MIYLNNAHHVVTLSAPNMPTGYIISCSPIQDLIRNNPVRYRKYIEEDDAVCIVHSEYVKFRQDQRTKWLGK